MVSLMSERKASWPAADADGLPVRFTSTDPRPRPDEYMPVLENEDLRLEPMQEKHLEPLCEIGMDPAISRLMPASLTTREQMTCFIRDALVARAALSAIPFVTVLAVDASAPQVVGTTRFMSIDPGNRRMEIGATWIGKKWQRTRVNTEAKYLMLRHAFETYQCIRIEFKTDSLNERSRAALLRIGAVQEGVFRNHVITADGRIRHSVYFSITQQEWPGTKARLERMLQERPS
jgi:RimJ/RimL family protein N-acetyltransferase